MYVTAGLAPIDSFVAKVVGTPLGKIHRSTVLTTETSTVDDYIIIKLRCVT